MNNLITEYLSHGYALVPIPKGQKGPNAKGWNSPENVIKDPKRATMIHRPPTQKPLKRPISPN